MHSSQSIVLRLFLFKPSQYQQVSIQNGVSSSFKFLINANNNKENCNQRLQHFFEKYAKTSTIVEII